jgi:hypothetical protein
VRSASADRSRETEAVQSLDLEAARLDCGDRIAATVAAAEEVRSDGRVDEALGTPESRRAGADVLEEAKLAAHPEDPAHLAQCGGQVGHRAEHQRRDDAVEGLVAGGQPVGGAVHYADGYRRQCCAAQGRLAQVRLRLNGEDGGHLGRVVGEVEREDVRVVVPALQLQTTGNALNGQGLVAESWRDDALGEFPARRQVLRCNSASSAGARRRTASRPWRGSPGGVAKRT